MAVTTPQAVFTRLEGKKKKLVLPNDRVVTTPQAVFTRLEGRAENPHHKGLKMAFWKNKQMFFNRKNKYRLHTMT